MVHSTTFIDCKTWLNFNFYNADCGSRYNPRGANFFPEIFP